MLNDLTLKQYIREKRKYARWFIILPDRDIEIWDIKKDQHGKMR